MKDFLLFLLCVIIIVGVIGAVVYKLYVDAGSDSMDIDDRSKSVPEHESETAETHEVESTSETEYVPIFHPSTDEFSPKTSY